MSKGEDTYFFVKTLQGDITKIIDENGTTAATYAYDAWGKILSENENSAIEGLNPFRYRGYVYDPETELYYLQSRYYDPITGRFLNLDNPEFSDTGSGTPLSTNMFAYCENNPVVGIDVKGCSSIKSSVQMTEKQSIFILNAIKWSGLKNKLYSISPLKKNFSGTKKYGKYKVYIFTEVLKNGAYMKSEYYILNKTIIGWEKYIKKNWGAYNSILSFANTISEIGFYSSAGSVKIKLICGTVYMLTAIHDKSFEENYINYMITKHFKKYFYKVGNRYYIRNEYIRFYKNDSVFLFSIPMYVINYKYSSNSKYPFEINKYYAYLF